jgi:hypothetical protein
LVSIRLRTLFRWLTYAAVPIVPTLVELANWPRWVALPFGYHVHVIYAWTVLVLAVGAVELAEKGRRRTEWLLYWQDRARTLAGSVDEIAQLVAGGQVGGGRPASPDRIAAGLLRQITDVVHDLTHPPPGVEIMACMLQPVEHTGAAGTMEPALQPVTYSENAGRHRARVPLDTPSPAAEAFKNGRPRVLADTEEDDYRSEVDEARRRSVMAFPVQIGGDPAGRLGVVTIDASAANVFNERLRVHKGVGRAILPYLKLLGLIRIAELKGGRRGKRAS